MFQVFNSVYILKSLDQEDIVFGLNYSDKETHSTTDTEQETVEVESYQTLTREFSDYFYLRLYNSNVKII